MPFLTGVVCALLVIFVWFALFVMMRKYLAMKATK